MVVDNLFPEDWYDHMLASVPPGEFFSHGARGVKSNLILTEEADRSLGFFELTPPYTRDVWTRVEKGRWCADSARWASSGRHVDHRDRRRVMISM